MSSEPLQASSYSREILQRLKRSAWDQRYVLGAVILGQFLSLCLCGTAVTSELLVSRHDVSVPTTQVFFNYLLLALTFGVYFATRKRFLTVLKYNWWKYIVLGVMDVEANFLVVLAYRYTNLTSIQLLDCFTIVVVMVLSYVFLKTRYKLINIMGVLLTLIGIACLVLADLNNPRNSGGSAMFLGDMLCLLGAVIYAAGNVSQEYLVKTHSIVEYLGLIGIVGSFVSGAQLIGLERMKIARIQWSLSIGGLFSGFGVSLFLFYSFTPWVIRMSSAVVFNLSLLTADFYTLMFGIFLFKYDFTGFYILGFSLVILGIFIYNLKHPVEKKLRERSRDQRKDRSIERLFSVATTKVDSSVEEEGDDKDWKIRGLLESSAVESTSASVGILSRSYQMKLTHYGTTAEPASPGSLPSPLHHDTRRHHSSAPVSRYCDRDDDNEYHGNRYYSHRNRAHVEIEAGRCLSQSAPSYSRGGEGERREEEEERGRREREGEGERETLRKTRSEGRRRHSSVREGVGGEGGGGGREGRGEKRRRSKPHESLEREYHINGQKEDLEGTEIRRGEEGGKEGGEEGGEEGGSVNKKESEGEHGTLRRGGSGGEVGDGEGVGEGIEREKRVEGKGHRVGKRRKSSASREKDSMTPQLTHREGKSPSPPLPSNRKRQRRKRSSVKQGDGSSPRNRKEVNRDRSAEDEGGRERSGSSVSELVTPHPTSETTKDPTTRETCSGSQKKSTVQDDVGDGDS